MSGYGKQISFAASVGIVLALALGLGLYYANPAANPSASTTTTSSLTSILACTPASPRSQADSSNATGTTVRKSNSSTTISSVEVSIGEPTSYPDSFCYGAGGVGFIGYQTFPVTVYAPMVENVTLAVSGEPQGELVHFSPDPVQAGPEGAQAEMTVIGGVEPTTANGGVNVTLTASAPENQQISQTDFRLSNNGIPLEIIQNTSSDLLSPWLMSVGSTGLAQTVFGLVYAPNATTAQDAAANLDILGQWVNGSVQTLPNSIQFSFSNSSPTLVPYVPNYIAVHEENNLTVSPQAGGDQIQFQYQAPSITLAVEETIDGVSHVQLVQVVILSPLEPPS